VSSEKVEKLRVQFESLPPDDQKAFLAIMRDAARATTFGLKDLINSKEDDGLRCPHCQNMEPKGIVRFGIRRGNQYYRCKSCARIFSCITGTFLRWTKKNFWTWKLFLKCMMEGHSISKSAKTCKISRVTAFMWRHKVLGALGRFHEGQPRMTGIVEADDTFLQLSFKGGVVPEGREARYRGDPADERGISKKNKVCVSCAVSRNGQVYSKISAMGHPKMEALRRVFRKRFSKEAIICTDKGKAYVKYSRLSPYSHKLMKNGIRKWGPYHVQNVNSYHSKLKSFLKRFKGVSTKYLNNYLVWCNVIQTGARTRIELLKLAVQALVFDRWVDVTDRPAVPVGV